MPTETIIINGEHIRDPTNGRLRLQTTNQVHPRRCCWQSPRNGDSETKTLDSGFLRAKHKKTTKNYLDPKLITFLACLWSLSINISSTTVVVDWHEQHNLDVLLPWNRNMCLFVQKEVGGSHTYCVLLFFGEPQKTATRRPTSCRITNIGLEL